MHRIDTDTAQADKFGAGKNGFTGGNPQTGRLPTALDEDFFDAVQEELCSVIEGAGIAPVKGSNGQVLAALKALLQPLSDNLSAFAGLTGAADRLAYFTAAKTLAVTPLTAVGRNIISKATVAEVLAYLGVGDGALMPIGAPVPWPLSTPPSGWMICNGSSFSGAVYPKLALAYPGLVLPDLRGEFIRGWDNGRGVDSGRVLMSSQGDAMRNFVSTIEQTSGYSLLWTAIPLVTGAFSIDSVNSNFANTAVSTGARPRKITLDPSKVVPTASENRPRNVAFNYIVRSV